MLHARRECQVIHLLDFSAGQHARHRDVELREDVLGHQLVVAGDDLDRDPVGGKSCQGRLGALFWWIEEGGEAHKDEFGFIANHGFGLIHSDLPRGNSQNAEAVLAQSLELSIDARARRIIQRMRARIPVQFVAD